MGGDLSDRRPEREEGEPPSPGGLIALSRRILWRLRRQGGGWLIRRAIQEVQDPLTAPGRVLNRVLRAAVSWSPWRRGRSSGADCLLAVWDTLAEPVTFDILFFLLAAEIQRRKLGLKGIHFMVVAASAEEERVHAADYEAVISAAARRDRLINMLLPAGQLLPSVQDMELLADRSEAQRRVLGWVSRHVFPENYSTNFRRSVSQDCYRLVNSQADTATAALRASPASRAYVEKWLEARGAGKRAVSLTLRSYGYNPARNSNLSIWFRFAGWLQERGYVPVFIPDSDSLAEAPLDVPPGALVMTEAAWNLGLRMALYECTYLNLSVSSGPAFLFLLNETARGVMAKMLTPGVSQNEPAFLHNLGFVVGGQLPFCTPLQRCSWEPETFDSLVQEFLDMERLIEASANGGRR